MGGGDKMKLVEKVRTFLDEKCNILTMGFYSDTISELEEEAAGGPIESPVEQLFYIEWKFRQFCNNKIKLLCLHPQYQDDTTKGFIVDFYVNMMAEVLTWQETSNPKKFKIITSIFPPHLGIEIDGHLWHEKTKEQVARDKKRERILTANGWQLLRFAGSEVYKNPTKSVQETLLFAFELRERYHQKLKMKFGEK